MHFEKNIIALIVILVIIVAVINILTTIHITVMEKQTDIGVLKAIGYSPRHIVSIFLLDGYYLGMIGVIFGIICGLFIIPHLDTLLTFVGDVVNLYMSFVNKIRKYNIALNL